MKDYIAISREIKRRGEAKRAARRRRMHHAMAACLLLCICIPVGFGVWQWASPAEATSLPPLSESAGEQVGSGDISDPSDFLPEESVPVNDEPVDSEEPREEASEEPDFSVEAEYPDYSEEPGVEASEEPGETSDSHAGEVSEEPPLEGPGEPILPPDTSSPPAMDAVELPDGTFLEILLFPIPGISQSESIFKEAIGVIGVTVDGKWDPRQGYILITEGKRIPNDKFVNGISRLETVFAEADLEYPSGSLTVEEAEELLFALYLYYL